MGVTYIPGYEAQLGPALANIGASLGAILKPNQALQLSLRDAFAKDPALLQRFADMEAASPGVLRSLGFGKGADIASSVPESIGSLVTRGLRPGVEAALQNPEIIATAGEHAVTGLTAGQQAQDVYELGAFRKAREFFQANPKVSIQDILTGKIDPQTAYALQKSGAGTFLGFQLQNYINQQDIDARTRLAKANDVSSLQDAVAKAKVSQAFSRYQTTNAGSPAAWAAYLYGPEVAKLIQEQPVTGDELNMVKVADQRATSQERIGQQFQASRYVTDLDSKIRNYQGEETGRTYLIQQLNDALTQMSRYGGPRLTAEWRKPTHIAGIAVPFTGRELIYRDEKGQLFTDPTVAIGGAINAASGGPSGATAGRVAPDSVFTQLYLKHNGDKAAVNAELRNLGFAEVP